MFIEVIKSKIHRVTVTRANLDYIGSITVDRALMRASGLFEGEKVSVVNVTNGNRVETYVIPGEEGSGAIELNGAAAHLFSAGDIVIIMSYAIVTPEEAADFRPKSYSRIQGQTGLSSERCPVQDKESPSVDPDAGTCGGAAVFRVPRSEMGGFYLGSPEL